MKHLVFLIILFPALLAGQAIVSDTAYVTRDTIEGVTYYQEVRSITYDNGQATTQTGPRLDSTEFVRRAFRDAHDALLPVAEGVRLLASSGDNYRTHRYYSDILAEVTGESYQTGVLPSGKFRDYLSSNYGGNVWRVFYDSAGVRKDFFVYYIAESNIGREITNAAQVINQGVDPVYVPGTADRRIRFFPYNENFSKVTLLVREGGGLVPFFVPLLDVRSIQTIVDDEGVDTGRTLFTDAQRQLRLVRVPVTLASEIPEGPGL